jgi:hypothetical protein
MTYDPASGHVFASGCGGICELDIGTRAAPTLTLIRVYDALNGDGIAADGEGHIYVANSSVSALGSLNLADNTASSVVDDIPGGADDVAPLVGAGGPPPATTLQFPVADLIRVSSPGPPSEATQTLTVTGVTPTADTHGTVVLAAGVVTYTPDEGYTGPADFSYQVCDDGTTGGAPDPKCATGTVRVTVVPQQAPSADSKQETTAENAGADVQLSGSDPGGAALTFNVVQGPRHGVLSGTPPNLTYTPTSDFVGVDSFTYTASNGGATSPPATVTVVVTAVNQPPTADTVHATTRQDAPLTLLDADILQHATPGPANESDQTLTVTAVDATADTHGSVSDATGRVTYVPDPSFSGEASFDYTVCDNGATGGKPDPQCATAQIDVSVGAATPIMIRPDSVTIAQGSTVTIDILANDDPGQGTLDPNTLTVASLPTLGDATVAGATIRYAAHAGAAGTDHFAYLVCDTSGACGSATVTVTITGPPLPPTATDDSYTIAENGTLHVPAPGVLANDSDPNAGDTLHLELVQGVQAGSLQLTSDGSFDYTPDANTTGYDHFTYRAVTEAGQASGVATVTIAVVGPPGPPTANDDSYSIQSGQTLAVQAPGVLGNDMAPDPADTLTAHLLTDTGRGTLLLHPDGSFTYTPAPGFSGADEFTYIARDAEGRESDPATVVIQTSPGGPPTPTVTSITPADGSRITGPAQIQALLVPPRHPDDQLLDGQLPIATRPGADDARHGNRNLGDCQLRPHTSRRRHVPDRDRGAGIRGRRPRPNHLPPRRRQLQARTLRHHLPRPHHRDTRGPALTRPHLRHH